MGLKSKALIHFSLEIDAAEIIIELKEH